MGSILGWEDPWRRKWHPIRVFLLGKCHEQRRLTCYSLWGCMVRHNLGTKQHQKQCWVLILQFSSVQFSHSVVPESLRPMNQASLSITNSWSPPKPMSIESMMLSNHLILCRPLLLLPPIFPSIRVFSNESALPITWPRHWNFSFNISPSSEHPEVISFRMD